MKKFKLIGLIVMVVLLVGVSIVFVGCRRQQHDFSPDAFGVVLNNDVSLGLLSGATMPVFDTSFFPELSLSAVVHTNVPSSQNVWQQLNGYQIGNPINIATFRITLQLSLIEPNHRTVLRYVDILNGHPDVFGASPYGNLHR